MLHATPCCSTPESCTRRLLTGKCSCTGRTWGLWIVLCFRGYQLQLTQSPIVQQAPTSSDSFGRCELCNCELKLSSTGKQQCQQWPATVPPVLKQFAVNNVGLVYVTHVCTPPGNLGRACTLHQQPCNQRSLQQLWPLIPHVSRTGLCESQLCLCR